MVLGVDEHDPQVPDNVVSDVEARRAEIENGDQTVWQGTKFEGENYQSLFQDMLSFVEVIEGEAPSS